MANTTSYPPKPSKRQKNLRRKRRVRDAKNKRLNTFANSDPIKVIKSRFRYLSLPEKVKGDILKEIARWYNNNGKLYTVDRLKFVNQCLIRYYADGSLPPTLNKVWFKKNRQGFLYGPWSTLFRLVQRQPKQVLKLARCYTVFATTGEPTLEQVNTFKSAVEAPYSGDHEDLLKLNKFNEKLYRHSHYIINKYVNKKFSDIEAPSKYLLYSRSNNEGHKTDIYWKLMDLFSNAKFNAMVQDKPWVFDTFSVSKEDFTIPYIPPAFRQFIKPYIMGQVNWLHEPGMKERIVTDFAKPLEHLTYPLGKRLYEIVSLVPWDSTFHEERGYAQIQNNLKKGKTCYCFDLSKATDRFPFSTQMAVLMSLDFGPNYLDQLEILEFAVQSDALLPNGERVRWAVGQPMGYYPSFAMFSLTHGMVLMEHLYSKGIEYKDQFVVHGDDLVIMDDNLAEFYKEFIGFAGVEMNDFKTVISTHCAEINSRLVTSHGIIPMHKWRPVSFESLGEQIHQWGPKAIQWLPCGQGLQEKVKLILSIPGVLPNGDSINPEGKSREERIASIPKELLDAISNTPANVKSFISFRHLVQDRFRRNYFIYSDTSVCDKFATNVVLQSYLDALNLADSLDREVLQDCYNFYLYNRCNVTSHTCDLYTHAMRTGNLSYMGDILSILSHQLAIFNDAFCPNNELFTFSFIKELNLQRFKGKKHNFRTSRLVKLINLLDRTRESASVQ